MYTCVSEPYDCINQEVFDNSVDVSGLFNFDGSGEGGIRTGGNNDGGFNPSNWIRLFTRRLPKRPTLLDMINYSILIFSQTKRQYY